MRLILLAAAFCPGLLAQQGQPLALTGVTVIDATGRPPQPAMTVLISNGRIARMAPANAIKPPPGAVTEDCSGKYLIPGLWDMHVHLSGSGDLDARLFVANG